MKLEWLGYLTLPARLIERGGRPPIAASDLAERLTPENVTVMPIRVEARFVRTRTESAIWNGLIGRYHYLGLATPVGRLVRYLIYGDATLLGAISFSDCAWNVGARNCLMHSLGFDDQSVRDAVICNNRFLILPTVKVKNLASRILSMSLRQVSDDWQRKFGRIPNIAETFVDPRRYAGTCYFAANWICVGHTRGFSKHGAKHVNRDAPKLLMMRGLTPARAQEAYNRATGATAPCCLIDRNWMR